MIAILIIIAIIAIIVYNATSKQKQIAKLKLRYERSLRTTDKRAALEAGRAYYSALRKGKNLTIYDEQAITNDLTTMSNS